MTAGKGEARGQEAPVRKPDRQGGEGAVGCGGHGPLRECVRFAVDSYLDELGDQPCEGLYRMVLAQVEAPLLAAVMRRVDNNLSRGAAVLGVSRTTLRKKLEDYGLRST